MPGVRLLVPIKPLDRAKSRLREFSGDDAAHADLVLALALDTISAAGAADGVDSVVVVTSDPRVSAELVALGVQCVPDGPSTGLNPALDHVARLLLAREPGLRLGAVQADLPALRPDELAAALRAAGTDRAYCPDRQGTGTTLLLAGEGGGLDPRFGLGSAAAHESSGARALSGPWPGLRCDVDTPADLRAAASLGLGPHTTNLLTAHSTERF